MNTWTIDSEEDEVFMGPVTERELEIRKKRCPRRTTIHKFPPIQIEDEEKGIKITRDSFGNVFIRDDDSICSDQLETTLNEEKSFKELLPSTAIVRKISDENDENQVETNLEEEIKVKMIESHPLDSLETKIQQLEISDSFESRKSEKIDDEYEKWNSNEYEKPNSDQFESNSTLKICENNSESLKSENSTSFTSSCYETAPENSNFVTKREKESKILKQFVELRVESQNTTERTDNFVTCDDEMSNLTDEFDKYKNFKLIDENSIESFDSIDSSSELILMGNEVSDSTGLTISSLRTDLTEDSLIPESRYSDSDYSRIDDKESNKEDKDSQTSFWYIAVDKKENCFIEPKIPIEMEKKENFLMPLSIKKPKEIRKPTNYKENKFKIPIVGLKTPDKKGLKFDNVVSPVAQYIKGSTLVTPLISNVLSNSISTNQKKKPTFSRSKIPRIQQQPPQPIIHRH